MAYVDAVTKRAPVQGEKVLMVLRQVFNHAIDKGWLERNQNPAAAFSKSLLPLKTPGALGFFQYQRSEANPTNSTLFVSEGLGTRR